MIRVKQHRVRFKCNHLFEMNKQEKIEGFDPNGVGVENGHFIGLPFEEAEAEVVLLPVPWDVTVSYRAGTAGGPANILQASTQLDLYDPAVSEAWKMGLYMRPPNTYWQQRSAELREEAAQYIEFLEKGGSIAEDRKMQRRLEAINHSAENLRQWVQDQSRDLLQAGKAVGLIGGDHSCPLGLMQALAERHPDFGILQIDAHMDLRKAYEGFPLSHASIFYNALQLSQLSCLVQLGIRDYCEAEWQLAQSERNRVHVGFAHELSSRQLQGAAFAAVIAPYLEVLPEQVYVSIDIDGLNPECCPNTGTPVPGGFHFEELMFILQEVVRSGRTIIGFDLCEVAGSPHEWDGNVGARIAYRMANLMGKSQGKVG